MHFATLPIHFSYFYLPNLNKQTKPQFRNKASLLVIAQGCTLGISA